MKNQILFALIGSFLLIAPALADNVRTSGVVDERVETHPRPGPDNLRLADPRVLEMLREQDRLNPGLPRHMTPGEREIWTRREPVEIDLDLNDIPDYSFLRPPAEYENNEAILMRWGQQNAVLTSMVVPITTGDSLARVKMVVSGPAQESQAASTLSSAGANLERVEFVHAASDSVWIRDYGPRFASGDFRRMIVDHEYDRPWRPNDNNIPSAFANELAVPIYELPLAQGGGNYHSFANGEAFITDTILYYNSGVSEGDVKDYFAAFQGVDLTFLDSLGVDQTGGTGGTWYDGTGHLDMWFMPIDDDTVMIGEYDEEEWNGIPHDVTEDAVDTLQGMGYDVIRTPGWRASGIHYTYTNGVIVNDLVITCEFGGAYASEDAQALAAYEQAFPDHNVIAVDCSGIIGSSGALHCIVKHMPYSEQYGARPPYYDWDQELKP